MSLSFVGIGIWDEWDISLRGLEELRTSDIIFAEEYTSRMKEGTLRRLERMVGKPIIIMERSDVEDGEEILAEAEKKKVSFMVPGDPMVSTTHVSLRLDAVKRGIEVKIIHSSSIISAAVSFSGLHVYKFGKLVTLARWRERYKPISPYDVILENKKRGLHTLLLLDIVDGEPMQAKYALNLLDRMEKIKGKGILGRRKRIILLSRVGSEREKMWYGTISQLKRKNLGEPPYTIIIPGELHYMEKEALEKLSF